MSCLRRTVQSVYPDRLIDGFNLVQAAIALGASCSIKIGSVWKTGGTAGIRAHTMTAETILSLRFLGDIQELLKKKWRQNTPVHYLLTRKASIKDIIESLGIPHTEISRISIKNDDLDFHFIPKGSEDITVHPLSPACPFTISSTLRPIPLKKISFMADITVGKLARLLIAAGIDTRLVPGGTMAEIAQNAADSSRILLSANRDLLKQSTVVFGRLVRNADPKGQFRDISCLFNLSRLFKPFSRCIECNELLTAIEKKEIRDRLEPLTRKYYSTFMICKNCGRIYWQGSHHQRMTQQLTELIS